MPAPGLHLDRLPAGVETVLLAGFTYYVLGDIFYQQQESHYVVVTPPTRVLAATPDAGLIPLNLGVAATTSGRVTTTGGS